MKDFPYKDAANVHVPIMLENITRVWLRMDGELFGDKSNVFGVSSLGPQDDAQGKPAFDAWKLAAAERE